MRTIHCEDALNWLETHRPVSGASFIASLPDHSEFPKLSLLEWKHWFTSTARLVLTACPDDGVTLFFQSDIKHEGAWVDKAFLCQKAAELEGHELLFHKIFCRAPPGITTFGRPAYSHLLCFSKTVRADVERSTPDVFPDVGEKSWARGMGTRAALLACEFVSKNTSTKTIVNPFCGEGAVLAAANSIGLEAVGIEKSPKRAEKARTLRLSDDRSEYVED